MLKAIGQYLDIQTLNFNPTLLIHLFFILVLCLIHLGFHFIDFLHLKTPQNFFEGALILTSMDAYHYAKGSRDLLDLLNINPNITEIFQVFSTLHPLALLCGIFAKWTNLDFILTWSSVLFSTSVGIALYWLVYQILMNVLQVCFSVKQTTESQINNLEFWIFFIPLLSFLGSLIAILSPSFYQRVGVGYFDTDMLLLTFPLLAFIFLLQFLRKPNLSFKSLVLFALFGYLAIIWHNGVQNLLLLGFILFLCLEFMDFLKTRKILPKDILLISVFLVILTPSFISWLILILLLIGIARFPQWFWIWLILGILYAAIFGLFNPLFSQINAYIFGATQYANTYVYASVVNGILETMPSNLPTLIERSGGIGVFSCAFLGFLSFGIFSLCVKFNFYPLFLKFNLKFFRHCFINNRQGFKEFLSIFLFLLPFSLLGLGAIKLGMRFSFFLTPIIALGIAFFIFGLLSIFKRLSTLILLAVAVVVALFIANLRYKIPPPILTHTEIRVFKSLDSKLNPQDILFSWWDYGYALRYFTKAQVLLDGARHSGAINFPIAKILLSPSPTLFYNFSLNLATAMQTLPAKKWNQIFEILSQDKGANLYLKALELESKPPKLANEAKVYWVLPLRILPLLANIDSFSNVNLENGKPLKSNTFIFWDSKQNPPNLAPQAIINLYNGFYTSYTTEQMDTLLTQINFGENSLLLSKDYLKSNMIQILLFANYPDKISASGNIVRILQLDEGA
ncbi:STT3 domain-containing protein [uncultured Helicobacter sp.]|uniref:STT3 domain-containing protein n=1 Tax=uncultured Helicobacter sp. TaxID=175537 RepID=UPI0026243DAC|nr:STT3 domain-containing protein [uncultured Helicobacter sp.]